MFALFYFSTSCTKKLLSTVLHSHLWREKKKSSCFLWVACEGSWADVQGVGFQHLWIRPDHFGKLLYSISCYLGTSLLHLSYFLLPPHLPVQFYCLNKLPVSDYVISYNNEYQLSTIQGNFQNYLDHTCSDNSFLPSLLS